MKKTASPTEAGPDPAERDELAQIATEAGEVATGQVAPARATKITIKPDGTVIRTEIASERARRETARKFAARTEVAQLRHRLNLSQPAFAARTGISVKTLRKWESGAVTPSGPSAALIRILQARPDILDLLPADEMVRKS